MMRGAAFFLGAALGLGALAAGCDGGDKPGPKHAGLDEGKTDPRKARELVVKSDEAREAHDYDTARELLGQAERYADTAVREEIRVAAELCDEQQAKSLAPEVVETAADGKCAPALKLAGKLVDGAPTPGFTAFVKKQVSKPIEQCLAGLVEAGKLSEARELGASAEAKKALEAADAKALAELLGGAVKAELGKALEEPLVRRAWAEALDKVDALVKSGQAGDAEYRSVLAQVRDGITADVKAAVATATQKKMASADDLKALDALLGLGRWSPPIVVFEDDRTELEKMQDKLARLAAGGSGEEPKTTPAPAPGAEPPLPAELAAARDELAFWVTCGTLRCKLGTSKPMWTWGRVDLMAKGDPKGAKVKTLPHAAALTVLGEAGGLALVEWQPALASAPKRTGWVDAKALKPTDTSALLPPANALVGVRVWGPLRDGEKVYELGTVSGATGEDVAVRRMSDGQEVKLTRAKLGLARVGKGTKVLALCQTPGKLEAAVVDDVSEPPGPMSDPIVTLTCVDAQGNPVGNKRQEQLGAVRLDPSWLGK
ncbi:MAG: hypothetical protein IT373_35440 [Polyangiaceae bacterium]|nr:hypothetical protein [Polyangiaceae bacterium]